EQRETRALRGGLRDRERDAQDRVRAELALVGRAVEVDEDLVDVALLGHVEADELGGDVVLHGLDRAFDTLAEGPRGVAVATLDGLEGTGRRARGDCCASERAVVERDLDLDGRVAARVEDLAGAYGLDAGHG